MPNSESWMSLMKRNIIWWHRNCQSVSYCWLQKKRLFHQLCLYKRNYMN